MEYTVALAKLQDLGRIEEIYAYARNFMEKHGNPNQWKKSYPPVAQLRQDIDEKKLFAITDGETVHGVFYFWVGEDPTYIRIEGSWRWDRPYGTIHRIAGDGTGGILRAAVRFAERKSDYLRMDTHEDNYVMQTALTNLGFSRRGIIHLEDGSPRIAYDFQKME